MKNKDLDYISSLLLESYKEHVKNESYIAETEERFAKNANKLDALFCIFNADERIRKTFAAKLDVDYEDLKVFLRVLQKV